MSMFTKMIYLLCFLLFMGPLAGCGKIPTTARTAGGEKVMIEAWHADSLAGPMKELKKAFEANHADILVNLTSGRSKELSERILKGEACDVFAPSDPQVVKGMFGREVDGKEAASWYVVFSANELVVVTGKGNPLGLKRMADLAKNGVKLARVTGEKDLATNRTIEFVTRAATAEGRPELAQQIIDGAVRENTIPEVVRAVISGKTHAGIVYLSAAVPVSDEVEIVSFPAKVNLSDSIRNAVTIPGTARYGRIAESFIGFMLSSEGRQILKKTGQPPIVPPIREGRVPFFAKELL